MIVLDTHALVWWLADASQLSKRARSTIKVAAKRDEVTASAASVLEIATLVRRGRLTLSLSFDDWLATVRKLPELKIAAINADIAACAGSYGDSVHGDPIDRLIVATTQLGKGRLVTADAAIRAQKIVPCVW
jgi:PIN domain nuclease of toxin-antitoxin system